MLACGLAGLATALEDPDGLAYFAAGLVLARRWGGLGPAADPARP